MTRSHTLTTTLGLILIAGLATGCESTPKETPGPVAEQPVQGRRPLARSGVRPVSQPIGRIGRTTGPGAKLLSTQVLSGPSKSPIGADPNNLPVDAAPGEMKQVRYAVKEAAAPDVLRVLVGELLDRPYLIGPGVQGNLTFDLDAAMTIGEIERFVGALASAFGWAIQDRDGVLVFSGAETVSTAPDAPVLQGSVAFPGDAPAVRVYGFDHLKPTDAKSLVTELANRATAKAVAVGRYLVIAERTEQLERFADLFAALDAPVFDGVEIWTYELSHLTPDRMIDTLRTIGASSGLAQDTVAFIPLGASPRMMVVSKDPTLQPLIRRWITQLDEPESAQAVQRYLYRIQHYDPTELSTVLTSLLAGKAVVGGGANSAGLMRLVFAPSANQIIVDGTPAQYAELVELLSVIDQPPQQVQLQAVIAEVSLTNALEYGVEYFLTLETGSGTLDLIGDALSLPASTGSAFFVGGDGFALIEALDRESNVTVLSTPTITLRDGVEATIQVGGETPIVQSVIDSGGQTGGSSDLRNEIVYRDTGIKLTVQPEINESGYVTLRILQEVNDAVANTTSGIDSPEFTTRLLETEVVAPHGATLLLGGIVDSSQSVRVDRIPILGELPLIGPLFSMNRDNVERTELIITITPTIIDDPNMAAALTSEFISSARSVELAIAAWPQAVPDELLDAVRRNTAPPAPEDGAAPTPTEPARPDTDQSTTTPARDEAPPVAAASSSALEWIVRLFSAARAGG